MVELLTFITGKFYTVKLGQPNSIFSMSVDTFFLNLALKLRYLFAINQKLISEYCYALSMDFPWSGFIFHCGFSNLPRFGELSNLAGLDCHLETRI